MDEAAQVRTAGRPLLPRRVHIARADRDHRLPQQGRRLRSLVQGFLADNAYDCGRSQAPGRQDRLHLGAPHLGTHHPHVHMIVPGGGISLDGTRWIGCPPNFFLPVKVLSRLFRLLMLEMLLAAHDAGRLQFFGDHAHLAGKAAFKAYLAPLHRTKWFVYSKRPFAGPEQVLAYLSRYTHRVAISNSRLIAADATGVTFSYKDSRIEGPGRYKTMTLKPDEFIRRFLMHVLPNGFHRIRHCGLLASGTKTETIARIRELITAVAPVQTAHQPQPPDSAPATDQATHPCPCCGGRMNIIETFKRGSTPHHRPTGPIIAVRIDTS